MCARVVLCVNTLSLSAVEREKQATLFPKVVKSPVDLGPYASYKNRPHSFMNLGNKLPDVTNRNSYRIPSFIPTGQQ